MHILLVHNIYQQSGGEDRVFFNEQKLLMRHGHRISTSVLTNDIIKDVSSKLKIALQLPWSPAGKKFLSQAISESCPDIVHVHNFFPLLTPSIYDACIEAGVPVVQTLHNYRPVCSGALLMRNGEICEKCITGSSYNAIFHRCYRNSFPGSWATARMITYHRKVKTWQNKVDRFIALTRFAKQKFIEADFPADKISVKPNFCEISGIKNEKLQFRAGAIFVGRLSEEKGVKTMLKAWRNLDIPLKIAGDGPLMDKLCCQQQSPIQFLGQITSKKISSEMLSASFLVMPSEWYEGFPMVLVESFAHGLPVVASKLGAMAEIVTDGITGLHFEPGNPHDLAQKIKWMHDHPEECRRMGEAARKEYGDKYSPEKNYQMLIGIYQQAIAENKNRSDACISQDHQHQGGK